MCTITPYAAFLQSTYHDLYASARNESDTISSGKINNIQGNPAKCQFLSFFFLVKPYNVHVHVPPSPLVLWVEPFKFVNIFGYLWKICRVLKNIQSLQKSMAYVYIFLWSEWCQDV